MPLSSGMKLGSYEILSPLGAGGMGEVWQARDPRLGREVAIRFCRRPSRPTRTACAASSRRFALPGATDTSASRRPLAGFDPDLPTESFGISPDGSRIALSDFDPQSDILIAEGVREIEPAPRAPR